MRFRLGFMFGMATGYVLGARAGRGRYEQIREGYRRFKESSTYDQLSNQATHVTDATRGLVASGLQAASGQMKQRAESSESIDIR